MSEDVEIDPIPLDDDQELLTEDEDELVELPQTEDDSEAVSRAYETLKRYVDSNSLPILQELTPAKFYSYLSRH